MSETTENPLRAQLLIQVLDGHEVDPVTARTESAPSEELFNQLIKVGEKVHEVSNDETYKPTALMLIGIELVAASLPKIMSTMITANLEHLRESKAKDDPDLYMAMVIDQLEKSGELLNKRYAVEAAAILDLVKETLNSLPDKDTVIQ